jgi:hypothetical protein
MTNHCLLDQLNSGGSNVAFVANCHRRVYFGGCGAVRFDARRRITGLASVQQLPGLGAGEFGGADDAHA